MVTALPRFRATTRDQILKLQAPLYRASGPGAVMKKIDTQTNKRGRSPRLDIIMSQHRLQPYIHDGIVTVKYRGKDYKFHFFVKNHVQLQPNITVGGWKGDIVVMRKGKKFGLVSMPSVLAPLADFAVRRFVNRVPQRTPFKIPKRLIFHKRG